MRSNEHRLKMSSLEDKVAALMAELLEVKTMLESRPREAESHNWTEIVKRGGRRGQPHGVRPNGRSSHSASTARRAAVGVQQTKGPEDASARSSAGSTDSSKSTHLQRTPVDGVRRIWGTLKSSTTAAVSATLKKLWPVSSSMTVRRKFREYGDNKTRWWFILKGEEKTLQTMEEDWERIQMHTNWKLEHCTAPSNQPHARTGNPRATKSPENSPANDISDGNSRASNDGPGNLSTSNTDTSTSPEKSSNATSSQPDNLQTIDVVINKCNSTESDVMTAFQPQQSTVPDSFLIQSQVQNEQT